VKKSQRTTESEDEMRPEYDFSKLKFVGRGIYAERFRRGTNLAELVERDRRANEDPRDDEEKRNR
jgi:hypothetical protein